MEDMLRMCALDFGTAPNYHLGQQEAIKQSDVVTVLRKAVKNPAQVVEYDRVPVEYGLTTRVRPIRIEDRADKQLRNKVIGMVKVRWDNCGREELTWEREQTMLVDTALDTGVSKGVSGYTAWHTGVCQGVFSLFDAAWSSSIEHGL
ncbi:hypothetical protein KSP39_PZI007471 [Platanthera zijinensis]|uniref:Reverse transcriptase n=1 Tax=Platanthera zijinensis TaxID=2320716 RepID=A0AAP0BQQ2_9ASPA